MLKPLKAIAKATSTLEAVSKFTPCPSCKAGRKLNSRGKYMNNTGQNSESINPSSANSYVPPKMWKDLSVEEKVERTREQVQNLFNNFYSLQTELRNLRRDFAAHSHDQSGQSVKRILEYENALGGLVGQAKLATADKDSVYF